MKKTLPDHLFEKYTVGNCSEEEKAIVEAWYLSELKGNQDRPSPQRIQVAKEQAWQAINPPVQKNYGIYKWSAAAAILVALLFVYKMQVSKQPIVTKSQTVSSTKTQVKAETMRYTSTVGNSMQKLPDGTIVILAKGSTLTLLSTFNQKYNREVELDGKAFFDVAHNPNKPFIIYSGNVRTTVMGTAFDITAIAGTRKITVNVIRGMVEVMNRKSHWMTYLKKNMQVISGERDEVVNRGTIDAAKELSWNKQDLEFDDVSLTDARPRLEEQFGYKILIKDVELGRSAFHYSMRPNESAESFIKSICYFIEASYTIDHKNKIISIQPLNQ
ncbi:FecR family protein [Pedobacter sp. PWIIR3]